MTTFTTSDGLELAYSDSGTGPVLLCLAGLTRNMTDFDDIAPAIQDRVRMVRMDYRGRGKSAFDPNFENYAIPVEARDALELLDHLGIDKACILGTSRGGLIAMFLAATTKERLSGVILNDIGPVLEQVGLSRILDFLGKDPGVETYAEAANMLARQNKNSFRNVPLTRWFSCAERWWKPGEAGLTIRYDPALRDAVEASFSAPAADLWPLFDALDGLPVGLVRGELSDLLSRKTLQEMRRRRPDMAWAEVTGRAHVPFLDEPEAIAVVETVISKL